LPLRWLPVHEIQETEGTFMSSHSDPAILALILAGGGITGRARGDCIGASGSLPSHSVAADLQRRLEQLESWAQTKTGQKGLTFSRFVKWTGVVAGLFGVGYVLKSFGDATRAGQGLYHSVKSRSDGDRNAILPPAPSYSGYGGSPVRHVARVQEFQAPPWAANWAAPPAHPVFQSAQPADSYGQPIRYVQPTLHGYR
jgi:hypothetical protein